MATLNELVYEIKQDIRPEISDDDIFSNELIIRKINIARATFIRNELNRNRSIPSDIIQSICDDLVMVDDNECCDLGLDCKVLRSKNKIPETIELHYNDAITSVGPTTNLINRWQFVTLHRARYAGSGRFNKNMIYAFLHNGYIYVTSNSKKVSLIDKINIQGVFENPLEATKFYCDDKKCYDKGKDKYPVKDWMFSSIKRAVKQELIPSTQARIDDKDDSDSKTTEING